MEEESDEKASVSCLVDYLFFPCNHGHLGQLDVSRPIHETFEITVRKIFWGYAKRLELTIHWEEPKA